MDTGSTAIPDRQVLTYDGRIGELFRIFIVNLLLTIVTLGIFRFWAITRMRRYMWSRMSAQGERFEYDGTGGQLFVGFLLAGLILIGMGLGAFALAYVLEQVASGLGIIAIFAFEFPIIVLALAAPFSAQRYRLSHSIWCGIRGGMEGSATGYGLRSLGYYLLAALTLYQLVPWATLRLLERRINASFVGTLRFESRGRPGQLYVRFLLTFLAMVALGAVVGIVVYGYLGPLIGLMIQAHQHPDLPIDPDVQRQLRVVPFVIIAAYLVFFLGAALLGCIYVAAFWRHVAGHTRLDAVRFSSDISGGGLLGLRITNILILVFTLGLGMPIVIHRSARFIARHLLYSGSIDTSALQQSSRRVPRFSEGMFQQLDAGSGII